MRYYKYDDKYLFSLEKETGFDKIEINEEQALSNCDELYYLIKLEKYKSKKTFAISNVSDLYMKEENIDILKLTKINESIPEKIKYLIEQRKVKAVNTSYEGFENCFSMEKSRKKRVNILALGDVGSTMLMGLKLLGGDCIESIGIFDRSEDKIKRWEYEMNQTSLPFEYNSFPEVHGIGREELFNCDLFAFCASKGVPPVGSAVKDVRMIQLEENSKLIKEYAQMAAEKNFKGIFAVVSDPVDPLCKVVYKESNGLLAPEQIKGYGLGVMNARAAYYAKRYEKFSQFLTDGRSFGPHGNDLVIADSISSYKNDLSEELTKLAVESNLEVRKTGFKPFIAPALSSGAISIIHTLTGKWHYSSNFIGGVYMGAKNRNTSAGVEIEKIDMPEELFERIFETYSKLQQL